MIDVAFDFTTDTPKGKDPDTYSPTLCTYHQALWSKELPNGEHMTLEATRAPFSLKWKDFNLSSDSIIVEMNYGKNKKIIDQVNLIHDDADAYFEKLWHRSYTIGGMTVFPMHRSSMNQMRGMNILISDRWDLTLECIRRHYAGETSPLTKVIESDRAFYDLFVDFKGYVDYFFFQDCVSKDYSRVDVWMGDATFAKSGLPTSVDEFFEFIRKEHEFLDKRNQRIKNYCLEHGL